MQSSKIDFLGKYNELIQTAIRSSVDFPAQLCDFIVKEFELEAVVLFKITNNNSLELIGKSSTAKKNITNEVQISCPNCKSILENNQVCKFIVQSNCSFNITDHMINEGCVLIKVADEQSALLKVAKKTNFTKNEIDNIELISECAKNLLKLWIGSKGILNNSLSTIISNIAQELRTPTNSIMGFASLLNEENLSPSQTEYVGTLKDNAFELLSVINDLIDLSKLESGITKVNLTSVNFKDYLNEVVSLFSSKIEKSKIEFVIDIDSGIPDNIKIDTQKLRYILLNILTNSVRLTERGKISLSVSAPNNKKLVFRISDTSPGLNAKKSTEFFQPFALNELHTSKFGNLTGLGLSLTKKYIEYLSGDISISSGIGKGITYTFAVAGEILTSIEGQLSELPKPIGTKNKVLVVEDDYATSKLLSNYLSKWGYEPTIVNSAQQAMKIVETQQFLAVIMDIILPDANGFELLKQFRENPLTKHMPVIVCSVEAEQQKAFMMGAVEYFVKPINYKFLVEVLTSYKLKKDSNILIVDDDIPTLNLIKEAVEQAGFNAIAEHQSAKVIGMIENLNLDLAIIDLDMPVVNGFDLIKMIKSNKSFSKLPIIIYTGKESYQDDLKKIDGLFADLLHKSSTNIEDLAETVNAMINRYDEPSTPEEVKEVKDSVKILLVEDYKHSQIIVTRLLKKNNFESIVVVENGLQAYEQVQEQHYDLILMDMQMPVMNGFEATQKIRELDDYRETPIIALTAFAMKGDREKCLEAGATDYIPKPIDSQEFIEKVKYYTENKVTKK
ncbi:MAG: response regulator [Ignavibacteriaceae bacterium]|nr:response regulator [Ignavibacterium sp.]MCC6255644.1 response regulator [Ignavibacteriaceae bacterium]HRN25237.1 response regulator [Ignavibacteriaceae bacterium]HRQ52971.1 response regulator [Ignavibacteriaceae bacterium]